MGILKTIGTKLKDTFAPSAEVSAERRLKTFGTESKAVAGAAIIGTAAAAIAAPVLITSAAARTAVKTAAVTATKKAVTYTASHPLKAAAIGAGTLYTAGLVSESDKPLETLSKAPSAAIEGGKATGKAIETGSIEPIIEYGKEHPIAAGVVTAGAAYIVGKTATGALVTSKILDTKNDIPAGSYLPTETMTEGKLLNTDADNIPITPETQIIGKTATTTALTKRKGRVKEQKTPIQRTSINIINQSRLIQNRKFIY